MINKSTISSHFNENFDLKELDSSEIIFITGGSELTDAIWYGIGYTAGSVKKAFAKYYDPNTAMCM